MKILLLILFSFSLFGQLPVTAPAVTGSNFSLVGAVGLPITTPRQVVEAFGLVQSVSTTQDFFFTVMLAPTTNTEQESILLGMTQQLGNFSFNKTKITPWFSVALGTALSNLTKINLSNTPGAIVSSSSINAAFTSQYVFGLGFQDTTHSRYEYGPIVKYVYTIGERGQTIVGIYYKVSLGKTK